MAGDFTEAWDAARGIDGWLTEGQARTLFTAAEHVPPGQWIVEIGSHHGKSTSLLARARPDGVDVLAIDPFDDPRWGGGTDALAIFRQNTDGFGVELERGYGAAVGRAWNRGAVGLLFVDGAHDYPTVAADIAAWVPHLAPGARVLLHDAFSSPGVTRAVFKATCFSPRFRYIGSSRSLACFEYGDVSPPRRLLSAVRMLVRLPWFARNVAVKVGLRRHWPLLHRALGHGSADIYPY